MNTNNEQSPRAGDGETLIERIEDLMTKIQAFGLACYVRDAGADQIAMQDEIRADLTMLAAAPAAAPAWQPIETAPKDGSLFLCWVLAVRYGETDEGQQYQEDVSQADFCHWQSHDDAPDGGWFEPCCGQIGDGQDVTHWMPLPAAPVLQAPATGDAS